MKNQLQISAIAIAVSLLSACAQTTEPPSETADMILTNGYVYAADEAHSTFEALAIRGNKIIAIGSDEDVEAYMGDATEIRDLGGKMVLPGLHDMHIHGLQIVPPNMCDLDSNAYSLEGLVPVLQECLAKYASEPDSWLVVSQWNPWEGNEASEQFPTMRAALDAVSRDQPIILRGNDGHQGAANSAALASGPVPINAETLKNELVEYRPFVGVDERGEPNGKLADSGRSLVTNNQPRNVGNAPPEELMPRVAAKLAESGITSIQQAKAGQSTLRYYDWLDDNGGLTFRVRAAIFVGGESQDFDSVDEAIEYAKELRSSVTESEFFKANGIKMMIDGVMEGDPRATPPSIPNAQVIDGYKQPIFSIDPVTEEVQITRYVDLDSDLCEQTRYNLESMDPDTFQAKNGFLPVQCSKVFGELFDSPETVKALISAAVENGFHVHTHVIADSAIRLATDAFEAAKPVADANGVTLSAAHLQLGKTVDYQRLGEMGIYVVMTYIWAEPDPEYEMMVIPFVDHVHSRDMLYSEENYYVQNAYATRSLEAYGAKLVFGSDAPVGSRDPRPFESMQTALTRQKEDGTGPVLNIGEAIDIHSAIASYTRTSAELMGHQEDIGTLEVGKTADLIVIDQNLVELAESGQAVDIGKTKVLTTIFNGEVVFERDE